MSGTGTSQTDTNSRFEDVDWDEINRSRRFVTPARATLLIGLAIVGALFLYDSLVAHVYLIADWRSDWIDWVFLVSIVVVLAYGIVPALERRRTVVRTLRRLRSRPLVLSAGGYLVLLGIVGLLWPLLDPGSSPTVYHYNPPVGFTSEVHAQCFGSTAGDPLDETCYGTLQYPLGTDSMGERTELLVLAGARPALYVLAIGGVLVVPIATAVGVIAGLRGGLVDKLLMSYVDLQLSIPAILIYFVVYMYYGPSLLVLLLAFGLFSWGGIARLVRSEVLQRRDDGHVTVARSLGASELYVVKRHVLPNITNTLLPAVCHLLALLVLYEAGVAFLGFHEASVDSWGSTISQSITAEIAGQHQTRASVPAYQIWWLSTLPALALTLTMVSFKLLGDGLRDALDPRGERR
ncbi:ABC transporter permease [Natronobacterium texcoconense]|uniref:Peptide/nickel transport system permease protein n=1 Tax=Natronobacterium texcoconense TaxID=1095778 RepID=A0A1H0YXF0_NATTX|nr:ABC transporter permease [Natronobacterium texcoconense]SDQ19601.1 peptide/nickel transport system permease protein [Natronobacterium texcoconense]